MWFVIYGILVIVSNLVGVGPAANWTWELTGDLWKLVTPFVFAALWWIWADYSGLNKRDEMERMELRKKARRKENLVALGMDTLTRRKRRP